MNSKGESHAAGDGEARDGVGIGPSAALGGDAREGLGMDTTAACDGTGRPGLAPSLTAGDSAPFDKKLGSGSDDGAGDAWNVAPANAFAAPAFGMEVGWETCRVVRADSGDNGRFLGRGLSLPPRLEEV